MDLTIPNDESGSTKTPLVRGSDVKMQGVDWVIPGWLAKGEVHVFTGRPSRRRHKSVLTMALAAQATNGGRWLDGKTPFQGRGQVEHYGNADIERFLMPSYAVAGGLHSERILFGSVKNALGAFSSPNESDGWKLVIIDDVSSVINVRSYSDSYHYLRRVEKMADRTGAAVIVVTESPRGVHKPYHHPARYIQGSQAWATLPSMIWILEEKPEGSFILVRRGRLPAPMDGGLRFCAPRFEKPEGREVQLTNVTALRFALEEAEAVSGDPDKLLAA